MTDYRNLSLWFAGVGPIAARPPLPGDVSADVAIVGAGCTEPFRSSWPTSPTRA